MAINKKPSRKFMVFRRLMFSKDKRGMFFTLISLLIVSVLVLGFSARIDPSIKSNLPVIERRVISINNHVKNIEHVYLERLLRIETLNTLKSFITKLESGSELNKDDFDSEFQKEIFKKLKPRLDALSKISEDELHIVTKFNPISAKVYQDNSTGPWRIGANFTTDLFVDGEIAQWNMTATITTKISIYGLKDPLYSVAGASNYIFKHQFRDNWTIENFKTHILNMTYKDEPRASNYLMRFVGDFSSSYCCGIESMVNLNKLRIDKPQFTIKTASFVDYCYFGGMACIGGDYGNFIRTIPGLSSKDQQNYNEDDKFYKFKIDSYHIGPYNLTKYSGDLCEYDQSTGDWDGDGCI